MSAVMLRMLCRQERQILEADEAILSVLKQLSMHSIRFHFHFEVRLSRAVPCGNHGKRCFSL